MRVEHKPRAVVEPPVDSNARSKNTTEKLLFILTYGLIGIPCGVLGCMYEAAQTGWKMGRTHARRWYDISVESRLRRQDR